MIQNDQSLIAEVAQSVLETMVFAISERSDSYPDCPLENCLFAEITYSGSRNGELSIIAPKPLCREWAEMMAGEDALDLVHDVLGEVTNIIGGNWLSRSFSGDENIKLNPPKVMVANSHHWDLVTRDESAVVLSVEDNPFILNLKARD